MLEVRHDRCEEPADREIGLEGGVASIGDVEGQRALRGAAAWL